MGMPTITIDGVELRVTQVQVEVDNDNVWRNPYDEQVTYNITAHPLKSGTKEIEKMARTESLEEKLKAAELTEEDALLYKHGVMELDGEYTDTGAQLLTQLLFNKNKTTLYEKLLTIEKAEK